MKTKFLEGKYGKAQIVIVLVIFLALALSSCAFLDHTPKAKLGKPDGKTWAVSTWTGSGTSKFSEPVKMPDGTLQMTTNYEIYVFECSSEWARITYDADEARNIWVPRSVLVTDPCGDAEQPTLTPGPMLEPLQ